MIVPIFKRIKKHIERVFVFILVVKIVKADQYLLEVAEDEAEDA